MATSSILGTTPPDPEVPGKDIDALGPSDSSDSGSDIQGERPMATAPDEPDELGALPSAPGSDTDAAGTGERGAATGDDPQPGADIGADQVRRRP